MTNHSIPTLYDWIGGADALAALTANFYAKVHRDEVLAPVFSAISAKHPAHVAAFIAEVFGGPKTYGDSLGGHDGMIRHHLTRNLTEQQRRRWIALLLDTYAELGLPDDPEFMSALVGYLEWGSRLAVLNSQPDVRAPDHSPMPHWGWGEVGGPYANEQQE